MIAILGWGSLLWEYAPDFDRWHESWFFDGPVLPLEFSRISKTRDGALTLAIDLRVGVPTRVAWCLSKRTELADTVADLRCREGTTIRNIGTLARNMGATQKGEPTESIRSWAEEKQLNAVVWTALASNFQKRVGQEFSVEAASHYLSQLPPESKARAAEYVWRAPDFVVTPLRSAVQVQPWFLGV